MIQKMKNSFLLILTNWFLVNFMTIKCLNYVDLEFQSEPLTVMVTPRDGRATFRCSALPSSAVISWLWNGELLIQESDSRFRVSDHRLVVHLPKKHNKEEIDLYDNSEIRCIVHYEKRALISSPARLIIGKLEPFPPSDDIHITVESGNTAVIPCVPPSSVPIAVTEFHFQDTVISKLTEHYHLMPSGNLQIFGAQTNDSGSYRCDVLNPFLNEKKMGKHMIILSVIETDKKQSPMFLSSPYNVTSIIMGSNVTLECASTGNPVPNVTWEKQNSRLPKGRHMQIGGNLLLLNVMQEDEGTYICRASNEIGEASVSTVLLFHEVPQLLSSSDDQQVMKGDNITVECVAKGYPEPKINWFHNGKRLTENNRITIKGGFLMIKKAFSKDSGIYQCFAVNHLGSPYATFVIEVSDNSDLSKEFVTDEDGEKGYNGHNMYPDQKGQKERKHKGAKMVPPSKPEVTRLSDNSAMVRWDVPQNDGLPILFFRVQYKDVTKRGSQWKTIDEDIASHLHAHVVTGLKTGGKYRFRIAAVYVNNDNKLGPSSAKFVLLKDPPSQRPESGPTITYAKAVSQSAITLDWNYSEVVEIAIEGFFIYYRATHSAGEYSQEIVLGSNTRSHILSHLLPDTSYDIKMQCFNLHGTSSFSNIYTAKTLSSEPLQSHGYSNIQQQDRSGSNGGSIGVSTKSVENSKLIYIILGSVLGIMLIILFIFIILCVRRQQRQRRHLQTTQAALELQAKPETNGHVHPRNGFIKATDKMNISINPLSEYLNEDETKLNQATDIQFNNNKRVGSIESSTREQPEMETLLDVSGEKNTDMPPG